ncbi:transposase DDE domain protein, partial [Neisseria meningitidis 81858]
KGTTVYADKGYDSAENRQHLEEHQLQDGMSAQSHLKAMCLNLLKAANRLSAPAAA